MKRSIAIAATAGALVVLAGCASLRPPPKNAERAQPRLQAEANQFLGEPIIPPLLRDREGNRLPPILEGSPKFSAFAASKKPEMRIQWLAMDLYNRLMPREYDRATVVAVALKNPLIVETGWKILRPTLRQEYGFIRLLRANEMFFKTPYTAARFAPLRECLAWHRTSQEFDESSHPEATRCDKIFATFGVRAVFGTRGDEFQEAAVENADYCLRWLERWASVPGGETFVRQVFQPHAIDLIKP